MRTAVCTGSFDPPTLGHMDIFMRAAELFDMVYVAVLTNPNKKPVFTADERCGLLIEAARAEGLNNVCAEAYSGLAVDFARQKVEIFAGTLDGLSPAKKLMQGYSVAVNDAGRNIRSTKDVQQGENIVIQVTDGAVLAEVTGIKERIRWEKN